MNELATNELATIVTPGLITGLVQMGKSFGLIPSGWEKVVVFLLSLVFAGIFFWNKDLTEMLVGVLGFCTASVGAYEIGVKPIEKALNKE